MYRWPKPLKWLEIHRTLQNAAEQFRESEKPPEPLVVKGWATSSSKEKHDRWQETIHWANEHDCAYCVNVLTEDEFVLGESCPLPDPLEVLEIVPGESIGPFRLGFTYEEMKAIPISRENFHIQHWNKGEASNILMDENISSSLKPWTANLKCTYVEGLCTEIEAVLWTEEPVYLLAGCIMNGTYEKDAMLVFELLTSDKNSFYGSIYLPTIGLTATKWEYSDLDYYVMSVIPKEI